MEPAYNDSANTPTNQPSVPSSDGVDDFLLSALEGDSDEEGGRVRAAPLQADAETLKSRKIRGMPRTRNTRPTLTTTSVEKLPPTNTTTSTTAQTHPATAPVSPPLDRPDSPWSPLRSLSSLPPDQPAHTPRRSPKDRKTDDIVEVHGSPTIDHSASFPPPSLGQSSRLEDLAAAAATISTAFQAKDTSHLPSPQPLTPVEAYSRPLGRAEVSVECPRPIFSSTGYYPQPHTPSPQLDAAVVDMTIDNATWGQESDHELMALDEDAPPSSEALPTQAPIFDMDMDRDIPVDIPIISDDNMEAPFTTATEQVAPGDAATGAWSQDAIIDAADHMTDDYHYQQAGTANPAAAPATFTDVYPTPDAVLMDNFASDSGASTEPAGYYSFLPPRLYPQYGYLTRAAESLQLQWLGGIFDLQQEDLTETFHGLAAWFSSEEYLTRRRARGYPAESAKILAHQCLAQNNILYDDASRKWCTWLPNEQTFTGTAAADSPETPAAPLNMSSPPQHTYPLHSESYPQAAQPFTTPDDEDPAAFLGSPPMPPSPASTVDPVPPLELPRTDYQADTTPPSPPQTPAATEPSTPVPTSSTVDIQPSAGVDSSSTPLKDSTDDAAFAPLTPPSSPEAATEPESPTMSSSSAYSPESPVPCPDESQGSTETTENKGSPADELRQQEADETKGTSADNAPRETDENTEGNAGAASKTSGASSTTGNSRSKIGLLVALWHLSKRRRKSDAPSDVPAPSSNPDVPLSSDPSPAEPPVQADSQPPAATTPANPHSNPASNPHPRPRTSNVRRRPESFDVVWGEISRALGHETERPTKRPRPSHPKAARCKPAMPPRRAFADRTKWQKKYTPVFYIV